MLTEDEAPSARRRKALHLGAARPFGRPRDVVTSAAALAPASRGLKRPAWLLVLTVDVVALLLPASFVPHGRWSLLAMSILDIVLLHASGQYRSRLKLSFFDDFFVFLGRGFVAYLIVAGVSKLVKVHSIRDFTICALFAIGLQLLGRLVSYGLVSWARMRGVISHRTVIVGSGEVAHRLARSLQQQPRLGLRPIGFLSDGDPAKLVSEGVPHVGRASDLGRAVETTGASVVIVAFHAGEDRHLVESLRLSERRGCDLFIVPRLFEIYNYGQSEHIGSIPVVRVQRPRLNRTTWLLKRALDVALSTLVLLLLSPLLVAVAAAVRLDGGPGVIFRQTRVGLDGREFQLLKFRSMKPAGETESATRWSIVADERLGRLGRLLRRTSIDELPQLFNVLRGEMTLVGPRPERPHFANQFAVDIPEYKYRHRVPAGLTGLAQINGLRGDTSIVDRARYDNYYIENWSLWLDIKILAATLREVVTARGA